MGQRKAEGSNGPEAPQERAQAKESTYIVMLIDGNDRWRDAVTITVPAKTKRRTVIEKALAEAGIDPVTEAIDTVHVRVLDEKSAQVTTVEWEQPPPQLKIGSGS